VKIPLASLGLREIDIAAAQRVLGSGKLTMGENVAKFEELMAKYLGVKYFVMVNSGSSANLAIFEALLRPSKGESILKPGDGVLVPAVAWPTTIWPIIQLGLKPVFVDVSSDTLALDLEKAQSFLVPNSGIKAIFPIHPLGFSIDHFALTDFCKKNSLIQINDVCESLGSWRNGIHAGVSGIASSFSFYFSHHITTMEGGGVATDSLDFADDLRAIRSHGWSRDRSDVDVWSRDFEESLLTSGVSANQNKFQFITTGYNIRPMEIQAAIGIEQLKDLDKFVQKRREVAREVREILIGTCFDVVDGGTFNSHETEEQHSWMLLCIRVNKELNPTERAKIESQLETFGIESRPVLTGNFLNQRAMKRIPGMPHGSEFPIAEEISRKCFMVGSHHDLAKEQISYLGKSLRTIAESLN
jgi:CDP-6-deoxy-D-xylo-4-hexulose-3-dehydrase